MVQKELPPGLGQCSAHFLQARREQQDPLDSQQAIKFTLLSPKTPLAKERWASRTASSKKKVLPSADFNTGGRKEYRSNCGYPQKYLPHRKRLGMTKDTRETG
jgi:hypothetical protein